MRAFILRRILWMVPTLLGISLITFGLLRLAPGDPGSARIGAEGAGDSASYLREFRRENLLDQPLWKQYLHYLGPFHLGEHGHEWFGGDGLDPWHGLLALDLGREYLRPSVTVAGEIARRLRVTLPLALAAAVLSYLIAIPLGIASAVRRGAPLDTTITVALFVLYALPTFWTALMLQLVFGASGLGWLPAIGLRDKDAASFAAGASALDLVRHSILPVACLAYGGLAYLSRQMRASLLDAIGQDYVRTARAKGLSERSVILKHALRNSLIPVVTLFGQVLPLLVGGSIAVESVFDLPGMGKYAYDGLVNREYNVVLGTVLVSALMTLVGFLVSDVLYAVVDPRIRHE